MSDDTRLPDADEQGGRSFAATLPDVTPLGPMQPTPDWILVRRADWDALRAALRPLARLGIGDHMDDARPFVSWVGLTVGDIRAARTVLKATGAVE